jgi:hypothetical protein
MQITMFSHNMPISRTEEVIDRVAEMMIDTTTNCVWLCAHFPLNMFEENTPEGFEYSKRQQMIDFFKKFKRGNMDKEEFETHVFDFIREHQSIQPPVFTMTAQQSAVLSMYETSRLKSIAAVNSLGYEYADLQKVALAKFKISITNKYIIDRMYGPDFVNLNILIDWITEFQKLSPQLKANFIIAIMSKAIQDCNYSQKSIIIVNREMLATAMNVKEDDISEIMISMIQQFVRDEYTGVIPYMWTFVINPDY